MFDLFDINLFECGGNISKSNGQYDVSSYVFLPVLTLLTQALKGESSSSALNVVAEHVDQVFLDRVVLCDSTDLEFRHMVELENKIRGLDPSELALVGIGSVRQNAAQQFLAGLGWNPSEERPFFTEEYTENSVRTEITPPAERLDGLGIVLISTELCPSTTDEAAQALYMQELTRNLEAALRVAELHRGQVCSVRSII